MYYLGLGVVKMIYAIHLTPLAKKMNARMSSSPAAGAIK